MKKKIKKISLAKEREQKIFKKRLFNTNKYFFHKNYRNNRSKNKRINHIKTLNDSKVIITVIHATTPPPAINPTLSKYILNNSIFTR